MGIAVHPTARSDSVSENTSSVVRSSRSCGYMANTAITREFNILFITITTLIVSLYIVEIAYIHIDDSLVVSNVARPHTSTYVDRVCHHTTFNITNAACHKMLG